MAITNYDMQMMAHKKREVVHLDRIATALEATAVEAALDRDPIAAIEFIQNYIGDDESCVSGFKHLVSELDSLIQLIEYNKNPTTNKE